MKKLFYIIIIYLFICQRFWRNKKQIINNYQINNNINIDNNNYNYNDDYISFFMASVKKEKMIIKKI